MPPPIHPLLLCGGSGTRLWPLSRKSYPKQFAKLTGERSLFQAAAKRVSGPGFAAPMAITGSDFRFIVTEQLAAIDIAATATLIEPEGRNTAPAILAAALVLHAQTPGALMLVCPSDHVIPDADGFRKTVHAAVPSALNGQLVTFGIRPDRPETGYGWLELESAPEAGLDPEPYALLSFVEKPDAPTAGEMLTGGRHLWNAGLFLFTTQTLLDAALRHAPALLADLQQAVEQAEPDLSFTRLAPEPWARVDSISIDYAVMEKADNLSVMPFEGAWSDLGDWDAVWRESDRDDDGIVTSGPATALDCSNTLLRAEAESQHLVGIGLKDMIAVSMPDAVLVAHRSDAQAVKTAVAALKAAGESQAETLPRDFRPWGWFESLVIGNRFQVKRIVVHPGASLSLQSHQHRAEHWIVVEGTAHVTIDDDIRLVTENQSVFIPLGARHRMENRGKVDMVLIEVQTGSYLGEDDIIRYEDVYARGEGPKG